MSWEIASEVRNWVGFFILVVGGFITVKTYVRTQKQRQFENTLKMIQIFRETISEDDMKEWRSLFYASSEPVGAKQGQFIYTDPITGSSSDADFDCLFGEGAPDNGATARIAHVFDLVSEQALARSDLRLVYFELGQMMDSVHRWTASVDSFSGDCSFLEQVYPNFFKLYESGMIDERWSSKFHTSCD